MKESRMKKILLVVLLFGAASLITFESCSKSTYVDATVVKDGDGITDGCGWLLSIGGSLFYHEGLREDCKVDGKVITIQYTVSVVPYKCVNNKEYPIAAISKYL